MKIKYLISLILLTILLSAALVTAFGVTLPYYPSNGYGELTGEPGQVIDMTFMLQNGVDNKDLILKASIKDGAEIAQIAGNDTLIVPFKAKDIPVKVKISIPSNAKTGDIFLVSLYLKTIEADAHGTALGTGIEQRVHIKIYKPNLKEKISRIIPFENKDIIGYSIILVLLIAVVLFMRKKKFNK